MKKYLLIGFIFLFLISLNFVSAYRATGGTITTILDVGTNYTIHTFTTNGTFNVTDVALTEVIALIVAGGGGGGGSNNWAGGGGGAGGLIYNTSVPVSGAMSVIVGSKGIFVFNNNGTEGGNSTFGTLSALGGGGGTDFLDGSGPNPGRRGGSGSGGAGSCASGGCGGNGTLGQGNNGGAGADGLAVYTAHGGGGGAGGVGQSATDVSASKSGGAGGIGANYSINGSIICYAGGGGGGTGGTTAGAVGGIGGCSGGNGGNTTQNGTSATGYGSGGGGGGGVAFRGGGDGSQGIVVIRYLTTGTAPVFTFETPTPTNNTINHYSNNTITINTSLLNINGVVNVSKNIYYENGNLYLTNWTNTINIPTTFTGLNVGRYYYNATADNGTVNRSTETRLFTVYNITTGTITVVSNASNLQEYLNLTWTNSTTTNNSVAISYYLINLLNNDTTFNRTLVNYTLNNLTNYNLYDQNLTIGRYYLQLNTTDVQGYSAQTTTQVNTTRNAQFNISINNRTINGINTFNITLMDRTTSINETYSTTNGIVTADLRKGDNYSILIDAAGYSYYTLSGYIQTETYNSTNITLYPSASIIINIYDESTLLQITENISVTITDIDNPYTSTQYTITGNITFLNLTGGDNYEIRFSSVNYSTSRYYSLVIDREYQILNAYLILRSLTQNVSFCFFDQNGAIIIDLHFYQYVLNGTNYLLTEDKYSDINGRLTTSFNPSRYYYYTWNSSSYATSAFILNPPTNSLVLASGCNYDVTLQPVSGTTSYSLLNVTGYSSYSNITRNLTLGYTSTDNTITNYSYTVSRYYNTIYTVICSGSSTALTSSASCDLTGYNGVIYVQQVANNNYVFYGTTYDIHTTDKLFANLEQKDAAYYAGFIMIIIVLGGVVYGLFGTMLSGIVGLFVIYWLGLLTPITSILIITDIVIVGVIMFSLKRFI